ncbi:MAG: type I-B CRISPR-associated protein Cas8b1/Cst1 [Christensenellaceae bacterium]|jgi:CRISPR-associated protein Cst1|nr:type I-B CRISPR-associated protein Cas8b1/Cst1 [Christensenellaceae bacterium]
MNEKHHEQGSGNSDSEVIVRLDTALFNAGVVGLVNILERGGIQHQINRDQLTISKADLIKADLAALYVEAIIDRYKETTRLYTSMSKMNSILDMKKVDDPKQFKENIKYIVGSFVQQSVLTGFEVLKADGIENNIAENISKLKEDTFENLEATKSLIREIYNDFEKEEIQKTLYMKNIMYTKINMIWSGIAFLHKNQVKFNITKVLNDRLIDSIREMLISGKKQKKRCCVCDIECDNLQSLSFIQNLGIDDGKKKSPFWNYKPDLSACPLCTFIYTCAPLGFNSIDQDLIFINENETIDGLINANSKREFDNIENKSRFSVITQLILKEMAEKKRELNNIEVLINQKLSNDKTRYSLNVVDKRLIKIFTDCKIELNSISKNKVNIGNSSKPEWISVLETVLDCLFYNKALYNTIHKFLKYGAYANTLMQMLMIEIKRKKKEEEKVQNNIKRAWAVWNNGQEVKNRFNDGSKNENKLNGIVIKLQNAVRSENRELFFDILIRLYSGINMPIPSGFLNGIESDDDFKEIGLAFILGLLGEPRKEKEDKEGKGE